MRYKSALVTSARGKLDGIVFTANRYGSSTRQRVKPAAVQTASQVQQRGYFRQASAAWATLTAAQRTAWAAYAANTPVPDRKMGGTTKLSANVMYTRSANVALRLGLALPSNAPTSYTLPTFPNGTAAASVGSASITVTVVDAAALATDKYLVFVSAPVNGTIQYFKGPYTYVGNYTGVALNGGQVVTAPIACGAGQKYFVRLLKYDTISTALSDSRQAVATASVATIAHVVSVTHSGSNAVWLFDTNVTPTGLPLGLKITAAQPIGLISWTANSVTLSYTVPVAGTETWTTVTPSGTSPLVQTGETGTVL